MSTEFRVLVAGEWMKQEDVLAELVSLRAQVAALGKCQADLDRVKELEGQLATAQARVAELEARVAELLP